MEIQIRLEFFYVLSVDYIFYNKCFLIYPSFFFQNVFFGVGGAVFSCVGDWTVAKQRGLLCITITILIMNIVNFIILEIGEWKFLRSEPPKHTMSEEDFETLRAWGKLLCLNYYCCFGHFIRTIFVFMNKYNATSIPCSKVT